MKKHLLTAIVTLLLAVGIAGSANALLLIDNSTYGNYNSSIGNSLNLTNPYNGTWLFPGDYQTYGDPTLNPVPFEPNLSAASSALGNWLTTPASLNGNWQYTNIPSTWAINTETAIIYKISSTTGYNNFVAKLGVDNGIFVWMDGIFINGWLAPGGAIAGEYQVSIAYLSPGDHYLQILREDHGASDNYIISATGVVPEPATMLLFGLGLLGLAGVRRKLKK